MKRKVLLLFLFFPFVVFSQLRERNSFNDWELMNLRGKIKKINERTFEVNFKHKNTLTFDNGVLMPVSFNYFFDDNGYIFYQEGIKTIDAKKKLLLSIILDT